MAHKPATPGTGFNAPLYLLDKNLDVIGTWEGGDVGSAVSDALTDVVVDDTTPTTLAAAVEQIILALGGSIDNS